MRRIQKYLSGLCAAALLLSLLLTGTAKADEITIYLMAENDQMLDLPLSAMPAWINGDIYVPYTAFDWTVTGLLRAGTDGDRVQVYPLQPERHACV